MAAISTHILRLLRFLSLPVSHHCLPVLHLGLAKPPAVGGVIIHEPLRTDTIALAFAVCPYLLHRRGMKGVWLSAVRSILIPLSITLLIHITITIHIYITITIYIRFCIP